MRALVIVVAVLTTVLAIVWTFQRRLISLPDSGPVASAGTVIPGARDVELTTSDGLALAAWLTPAQNTHRGMTVLVANGNGGDRSLRAPLAWALANEGFRVLLFDYRGYGSNPGSPSEAGLARDVRAAYDFLVSELDMRPGRILYYGESLGAAVVTELAAEHPPAGLVLRSPFTDLAAVGRVHYPYLPVRTLLRDDFALTSHLADVDVPVTVVYGTSDSIVPPNQSRSVAESAPQLRQLVEVVGADHNDRALLDGDELIDAVVDLADHVGATS